MKILCLIILFFCSISISGQSIVGHWVTYDDKTNVKKATIEIYKNDNLYFAKIVESFVEGKSDFCETCKGKQKGRPIIGLGIIENLKKEGNIYTGGTILDPENGETYSCKIKLVTENKLKVRGFLGFSLLGRTQYWIRKN